MQNEPPKSVPIVPDQSPSQEHDVSSSTDVDSIDAELLALFPPGAVFPIWSPYDSYDAAATLFEALAEYEKKRNNDNYS